MQANADALKAAYFDLARLLHPDKCSVDSATVVSLTSALNLHWPNALLHSGGRFITSLLAAAPRIVTCSLGSTRYKRHGRCCGSLICARRTMHSCSRRMHTRATRSLWHLRTWRGRTTMAQTLYAAAVATASFFHRMTTAASCWNVTPAPLNICTSRWRDHGGKRDGCQLNLCAHLCPSQRATSRNRAARGWSNLPVDLHVEHWASFVSLRA